VRWLMTTRLYRWTLGFGLLAALQPPCPAAPPITPSVNYIIPNHCGSVIPDANSTGTMTLAVSPIPGGTRTVSSPGPTLWYGGPVCLGAFTITGAQGDSWTVTHAGSGTITLTLTGSSPPKTMTVNYSSVTLALTSPQKFPAGPANSSTTTQPQYFGFTVNARTASLNPAGTYTGTLTLTVKDTTNNKSISPGFAIAIKVDHTPISLTKNADLAFGAVFRSTGGGTVAMDPTGARTPSGVTVTGLKPVAPASFTVAGSTGAAYSITLPPVTPQILLTGPGTSMLVDGFVSSPSGSGILDSTGHQTLTVGATLHVNPNQADGDYTGTFPVTVTYN